MILPTPPKLNLRWDYPTLERITRLDGVRHYVEPVPNGRHLPSVTTILSETADKSALKEWQERVGEKAANKARNDGTALGNLVHQHMEDYLLGRERPRGNNTIRQMAARMADQIINRGLIHVDEVWGVESMLYYPGLYAGTTDLVGIYKGKPAIMDFKNAKIMRKKDMIEDYFCQGAAYGIAHDHLFETEIDTIVIFMVARDLQFETFVIEGQEYYDYCEKYLKRVDAYDESLKVRSAA